MARSRLGGLQAEALLTLTFTPTLTLTLTLTLTPTLTPTLTLSLTLTFTLALTQAEALDALGVTSELAATLGLATEEAPPRP